MSDQTEDEWRGQDLVPDQATALLIGRVILERHFGRDLIAKFEPYSASRMVGDRNDAWYVCGETEAVREFRREQERLGPAVHRFMRGGGFPVVRIAPKDGRILSMAFDR